MKDPRYWFKHRRTRNALAGYPLYDAPHKRRDAELTEAQARENFDYFMQVRLQRLAFVTRWLSENFRLNLAYKGEAALALDKWIDGYGGGLLEARHENLYAYESYQPAWQGDLCGCNVVFDIGIFLGEYVIARNPHLRWNYCGITGPDYDPDDEEDFDPEHTEPFVARPFVDGFNITYAYHPLYRTIGDVFASNKRSKLGASKFRYRLHGFVYDVRQALKIASLPKGLSEYIFEDYSDSPL